MKTTFIILVAFMLGALTIKFFPTTSIPKEAAPVLVTSTGMSTINSAENNQVWSDLKNELDEAAKDRMLLRSELNQLRKEFSTEISNVNDELRSNVLTAEQFSDQSVFSTIMADGLRSLGRVDPETQRRMLSSAGFGDDEINRIELLQESFKQEGKSLPFGVNKEEARAIRNELGDERYKQYLEATGQGTEVIAMEVLPGSSAEVAGLEAGDQIVSYNGEQVYQPQELMELVSDPTTGNDVVVEIMRNGEPQTVVLPEGVIGIALSSNSSNFDSVIMIQDSVPLGN